MGNKDKSRIAMLNREDIIDGVEIVDHDEVEKAVSETAQRQKPDFLAR